MPSGLDDYSDDQPISLYLEGQDWAFVRLHSRYLPYVRAFLFCRASRWYKSAAPIVAVGSRRLVVRLPARNGSHRLFAFESRSPDCEHRCGRLDVANNQKKQNSFFAPKDYKELTFISCSLNLLAIEC
jgi:hypothetical protein